MSTWDSPACIMIGCKCLRSVTAKTRMDWRAIPLGVRVFPIVVVLGEMSPVRSMKRTRLFVLVIVLDAFCVVIVLSLERSIAERSGAKNRLIDDYL